jgi:hypothetical protein
MRQVGQYLLQAPLNSAALVIRRNNDAVAHSGLRSQVSGLRSQVSVKAKIITPSRVKDNLA